MLHYTDINLCTLLYVVPINFYEEIIKNNFKEKIMELVEKGEVCLCGALTASSSFTLHIGDLGIVTVF